MKLRSSKEFRENLVEQEVKLWIERFMWEDTEECRASIRCQINEMLRLGHLPKLQKMLDKYNEKAQITDEQ